MFPFSSPTSEEEKNKLYQDLGLNNVEDVDKKYVLEAFEEIISNPSELLKGVANVPFASNVFIYNKTVNLAKEKQKTENNSKQ